MHSMPSSWFEIRKDDMCHMMNDSPKNDINISNF